MAKKNGSDRANSDNLLISVPTRFIRDWITSRYLDNVIQVVKSHNKNINRIEFKINSTSLVSSDEEKTNENGQDNVINANLAFIKDTFIQYNRIDPNKNFDNFIVGSSNSLAFEASKKILTKFQTTILYIYIQV